VGRGGEKTGGGGKGVGGWGGNKEGVSEYGGGGGRGEPGEKVEGGEGGGLREEEWTSVRRDKWGEQESHEKKSVLTAGDAGKVVTSDKGDRRGRLVSIERGSEKRKIRRCRTLGFQKKGDLDQHGGRRGEPGEKTGGRT